jgi:LIM domain kinase 1
MIPDADINYQYLSDFKLIGKGIFGVVYKASYLGTDVAVKECLPFIKQYGFDFEKVFNREVSILKECRHPNIVQYMGTCVHDDKFYIVTEFVKNDNLKTWITERIDEFPWKLRVNFAIDIARTLVYLHSKNIMHRDIKPENILITENGRAKICDFGFSRFAAKTEEEKRRLSYCGTETYMAPEIILCMDFNESIDIFGFGMILCEMIAGQLAEKAYKRKIPGFEIDSEDVYRYYEKDPLCPEAFVKLAINCTKYEEKERPSWKTIISTLNEIDEAIENSYNIGIIPAAGLISNDFLIPLSPAIKGQTIDYSGGTTTIKKTNSVKSLNLDTEELKNSNQKHYNGRPTSPILNTSRMNNQNYYYYYAINNPSNANDPSKNIYRRLPVYITPPLEHSSIIAVPKDIPKLSLNSPVISDTDILSNIKIKKSEQIVLTKEELQESTSSSLSPSSSHTNNHICSNHSSKDYPSPSYSPSISPTNKANTTSKNHLDMTSLTLNNSSFIQSEGSSSPSTSPQNSYNYLKNYAILNNVDDIMKNQTYNNIVLDKDRSRSTVDMKAELNKKLKPSSKWNSSLNLSLSRSRSRSRSPSYSHSPTSSPSPSPHRRHHHHYFHHYSNYQSHYDTEEEEDDDDEIQSTVSSSYDKNTTLCATSPKLTTTPSPTNANQKSNHKHDKHVSLSSLMDIRSYSNVVQKRKESLSQRSSLLFDNDKTLTIPDNNNKSYVMPTIEDIYNSEIITGIHHRFSINNIPCLSKCNVCKRRMSLVKRYLVCDDCNFRCHAKCSSLAPFSCTCTNRKK